MEIGNNGRGLPADFNFRESKNFGLSLFTMLAEGQLEGKIILDGTNGVKIYYYLG